MSLWVALAILSALLIVVPWVLYPIAVLLTARRWAPLPPPTRQPTPLITVVLATREPPASVHERLRDLVSGDWPADRLELIVTVDGDPAPYQFEGLSPAPGRLAVVSHGAEPGKAAALNAGVAAATGDLVVFADTAQRFAPDAIPRLVEALGDPRFGAVSGALELGDEARPGSPIVRYWRLEKRLRAAEARLHSTIGVTGAIYAMRRELWTPLPPGLILDDLWVPMRLILNGHRVGFVPEATAHDPRVMTARQEFARKVRTLTGNLQLMAWMPELLLPWRNPVWVQFICHKLLRLLTPWALLALAAGALGFLSEWMPGAAWILLAVVVVLTGLALSRRGATTRLGRIIIWGLAMQGAVLVATWNGLRGRWDVWTR